MELTWTSSFANRNTPTLNGIQSALQYEGFGDPSGIAFIVQNNCLPSRCTVNHLDIAMVLQSMQDGWLSSFQCVCLEIDDEDRSRPEEFILQTVSADAVLFFYHSSARGGTFGLKILFKSEMTNEIMQWLAGPLKELEKADGAADQGKFLLLGRDMYNGLECRRADVKLKEMDLERMYAPEVEKFAERAVPELAGDSAGLYILHGPPGTGKTTFVNYLVGKVARNFIFIPYNLVDSLPLPEFTELLWQYRNSILIIEDAEKALQRRTSTEHSPVSALLNLTDGLLGDVLNLKVICTLNSDLANIDPALLRKGRLKGKCFFGKLSASKANALADHLGNGARFEGEVVLADVFRPDDVEFGQKNSKTVGFK